MENYRKTLKIKLILFLAAALIIAAALIVCGRLDVKPDLGDERFENFWMGFISGAGGGLAALFVVFAARCIMALRDDAALKKLYVKDHDERDKAVREKGKAAGATIFMFALLPAMIVAGYFSFTVFAAMFACEMALCVTIAVCKLYYAKTM